MRLVNEQEMIAELGCTREAFLGYLDANVFAPAIRNKGRGRPGKNPNRGAVYCADQVQAEVSAFLAGKFTPNPVIGPTSERSEGTGRSTFGKPDGHRGELGEVSTHGAVIRIEGRIPGEPGAEAREVEFDFAKEIGDISTYKLLKAAVVSVTGRMDVPLKVKKDLHKTFELLSKDREKRAARKKKVPLEKYEADCQKVHEAWANAWKNATGALAAQSIVEAFERKTGKQIRREISNAVEIVHRLIVQASNEIVQPDVLALLEKR